MAATVSLTGVNEGLYIVTKKRKLAGRDNWQTWAEDICRENFIYRGSVTLWHGDIFEIFTFTTAVDTDDDGWFYIFDWDKVA